MMKFQMLRNTNKGRAVPDSGFDLSCWLLVQQHSDFYEVMWHENADLILFLLPYTV